MFGNVSETVTSMKEDDAAVSPIIAVFFLLLLTVLLVGLMSEFVFGFVNLVDQPAEGSVQVESEYEEFNNTYEVAVVVTEMPDADYMELRYTNTTSNNEDVKRLNKVGAKTTFYVKPESSVRVVSVRTSDDTATLTRQWKAPSQ